MEALRKFIHQAITDHQNVEDDILVIYQKTLKNIKSGKDKLQEKERCINEVKAIITT